MEISKCMEYVGTKKFKKKRKEEIIEQYERKTKKKIGKQITI